MIGKSNSKHRTLMAVTIEIPSALVQFSGNEDEIDVSGGTVGASFDNLLAQHAALKPHLFEDSGEFRNFVNVYLNDDDIRQLSGRDTPVEDGDLIQIVPSIAGGWA